VDSSSSLIEICKSRFPNERWVVQDMRELSLNHRYNGILAWDSFFHRGRDPQRIMSPVFGKHAVSGTVLMFTSGPSSGDAIGAYRGERLYHASLDGEEYRCLLDANGFDVALARRRRSGLWWPYHLANATPVGFALDPQAQQDLASSACPARKRPNANQRRKANVPF
jgi:hypothetical protein